MLDQPHSAEEHEGFFLCQLSTSIQGAAPPIGRFHNTEVGYEYVDFGFVII